MDMMLEQAADGNADALMQGTEQSGTVKATVASSRYCTMKIDQLPTRTRWTQLRAHSWILKS
jgi:hypothetical protein